MLQRVGGAPHLTGDRGLEQWEAASTSKSSRKTESARGASCQSPCVSVPTDNLPLLGYCPPRRLRVDT